MINIIIYQFQLKMAVIQAPHEIVTHLCFEIEFCMYVRTYMCMYALRMYLRSNTYVCTL